MEHGEKYVMISVIEKQESNFGKNRYLNEVGVGQVKVFAFNVIKVFQGTVM